MKTRLDADKVEIVNIEEIRKEYPLMPKELFDKIDARFSWDIGDEIVMAVEDLKFSLAYDKWEENNREDLDHEWNNRQKCSVCGEYILIDDELYQDEVSGKPLCDRHSIMNESTNNYQSITDKEWEVRSHCQDCTLCEKVVFTPTDNVIQENWVCQQYTDDDNNPMSCVDVVDECKLTLSLSN